MWHRCGEAADFRGDEQEVAGVREARVRARRASADDGAIRVLRGDSAAETVPVGQIDGGQSRTVGKVTGECQQAPTKDRPLSIFSEVSSC